MFVNKYVHSLQFNINAFTILRNIPNSTKTFSDDELIILILNIGIQVVVIHDNLFTIVINLCSPSQHATKYIMKTNTRRHWNYG